MTVAAPTTGITRALAEFALSIEPKNVAEEVLHETQRGFLDCIGAAIGGLVTPSGQIAADLVSGERGPLEATVIGAGATSLMPAAFANTVLVNALDFEPVGPEGHVCAVAAPVALAVAEAVDASGEELLAGLLAGLEIGGRVGGAIRRAGQAGFKETPSVRGTAHAVFAAVAAAGRLLQLTPDQMHNAFGIAGYSATLPTLKKVMTSDHAPMTKYDHLGLMAQNGIQAALLAKRGFTGDRDVLEGELGFWRFAGALGCDWEFFTRDLGSFWTIPQTWYKRYPVILYTTPAIDLSRRLVAENGIALESIEHIELAVTRGNGVQAGKEILDSMDAWTKYSYNVAAGLYDIRPRRSWQEVATYRRPDLLSLAQKVDTRPIQSAEVTTSGNYWEGWCPVKATVMAGGRAYEGTLDCLPRIDDQELSAKFQDNVRGLIRDEAVAPLEQGCWHLSTVRKTRDLTALMQAIR